MTNIRYAQNFLIWHKTDWNLAKYMLGLGKMQPDPKWKFLLELGSPLRTLGVVCDSSSSLPCQMGPYAFRVFKGRPWYCDLCLKLFCCYKRILLLRGQLANTLPILCFRAFYDRLYNVNTWFMWHVVALKYFFFLWNHAQNSWKEYDFDIIFSSVVEFPLILFFDLLWKYAWKEIWFWYNLFLSDVVVNPCTI